LNIPNLLEESFIPINAVEGFHRQVRKVTKTKGFVNDMALLKLVYPGHKKKHTKKWTSPSIIGV
jgi:transposase-like protein